MKVSIILPVLDEASSIDAMYQRLMSVASSLRLEFQFVFVDDGSTGGPVDKVREVKGRPLYVIKEGLGVDGRIVDVSTRHPFALLSATDSPGSDSEWQPRS